MAVNQDALNEYIYSGSAFFKCEIYIDGIKEELELINLTVNGSDNNVAIPFGNIFSQYISITIRNRLLMAGQQIFIRFIPEGFVEPINCGAFYVQGEPSISGENYTYQAYDKTIYFDTPMDFYTYEKPELQPDEYGNYDVTVRCAGFWLLEEAAKYMGLLPNFPETDSLWKKEKGQLAGAAVIEVERYYSKRFMGGNFNREYVINDIPKMSISNLIRIIAIITGTNFKVESKIENGEVVELLTASPAFSETITDADGNPIVLDYKNVVYSEDGGTTGAAVELLNKITVKSKKYEVSEQLGDENYDIIYSEEDVETVIGGSENLSGEISIEMPLLYRNGEESKLTNAISNVLNTIKPNAEGFSRYNLKMIGDPRLKRGCYMNIGDLKCYIGTISYSYDGGIYMNIGSGDSENTAIAMSGTTLASIAAAVQKLNIDTRNMSYNKLTVDELTVRIGMFGFLKADELAVKVADIENLNVNSAFMQYLKSNVIDTDSIKAAVADIDILETDSAFMQYLKSNLVDTKMIQAAVADVGFLTANEADVRYASISELDALAGSFEALDSKAITTDNLGANVASLGYLTASQADIKYATVGNLNALTASFNELDSKAITTDNLDVSVADLGYLTADQAQIRYAAIDLANVTKATIGTVLADVGLISSATIEDGHVTGYLDSVSINANSIKAGTLSVDRLVINGTEDSIIYALNNAGELTSNHCNTLDGGLLTERTITGDHIVAGSITATEINATDLFAQDITASGTITGANLVGSSFKTNTAEFTSHGNNYFHMLGDAAPLIIDKAETNEEVWLQNDAIIIKEGSDIYNELTSKGINTGNDNLQSFFKVDVKRSSIRLIGMYFNDNVSPGSMDGCQLGEPGHRWSNVYAYRFNGYKLGNACTRTYTTTISDITDESLYLPTCGVVYNYASPKIGSESLSRCCMGMFGSACTKHYNSSDSGIANQSDEVPTCGAVYSYIYSNLYIKKIGTEYRTVSVLAWNGRPYSQTIYFNEKYTNVVLVIMRPRINNDWMFCSITGWTDTTVEITTANWYSSALSGTIIFDIYGY